MRAASASAGYLSLAPLVEAKPIDEAAAELFAQHGLELPGGPSGRGWSTRALFMACPYKARVRASERDSGGVVRKRSQALEVGGLFHLLRALAALRQIPGQERYDVITSDLLRDHLLNSGCSAEAVMEGYRLDAAYSCRYENDYLRPLAVEQFAEDPEGNTCRYDLLADVLPNEQGVAQGTWIVEHKTSSRLDISTLEGWRNDGEILGQMMVWSRARLAKTYGALQGVMVDITVKTKIAEFRRICLPISRKQIRQHAADLRVYRAFESLCAATGTYPRARSACVGRFGLCEYFDHCAGDAL